MHIEGLLGAILFPVTARKDDLCSGYQHLHVLRRLLGFAE